MAYSTTSKSNATTSGIGTEEWSPDLDPDDLRELQEAQHDPSKIVVSLPRESVRMGYFSTLCLLWNRMIGVGIFSSASVVFSNTQSIGLSLLIWFFAGLFALAGVIVYIELGLTIPRWPFGPNGEKISTPRSGEALNYFNYYLRRPLFFATCLFGITFIILENTAPNSVSFAQNVLDASNTQATPGKIIAISLTANLFCCLLHAISRKWGIILNNIFGVVKFLILVFIVIIGLIWINRDVASTNFSSTTSFNFDNSPKKPFRYAEAFLNALYPYGLFHQINYVISELDQPRKVFPRVSFYGVLTVCIIYTAVNITWAAIIPKTELFTPGGINVGLRFMQLTLGRVVTNENRLSTIWSTLKAISAGGNLVVVTFTVARVKQEVAKEGILPYSLFFAKGYDLSLGKLFKRRSSKADFGTFSTERTPAAALALHWVITTILVLGAVIAIQPQPYSSTPAFTFMSIVFAYVIYTTVFIFISFGLLCLRLSPKVHWAEKSEFKHPWVSVSSALIVFVGSIFPVLFMWIPDPAFKFLAGTTNVVPWYASQTFGLGVVALAFLYWVGLRCYISVRSARGGKTLYVKREPKFKADSGGLTQIAEIVTLQWVREVGLRLDEIEERGGPGYPTGRQELNAPDDVARLRHFARSPDGWSAEPGQDMISEEGRLQYHEMYELPTVDFKSD